jgi:hypothetical protein
MFVHLVVFEENDCVMPLEIFETHELAKAYIEKANEEGLEIRKMETNRPAAVLWATSPLRSYYYATLESQLDKPVEAIGGSVLDFNGDGVDMDRFPSSKQIELMDEGTPRIVWYRVWAMDEREARSCYVAAVGHYRKNMAALAVTGKADVL